MNLIYAVALYTREVYRFRKLFLDTILSPIFNLILYTGIMGVVLHDRFIGNIPFITFIYSGLLCTTMINSSFSNPSFALVIAKNLGSIIDLKCVPIKPKNIGFAYVFAALTRAIVTLIITLVITIWAIPNFTIHHPILLILSIFLVGFQFGLLGFIFGLKAENFEALTFMTTFVMQPMIFLSGVFYPISTLPNPWNFISLSNPIYHNVNLFRYSLLNYSDSSIWISLTISITITILLTFIMAKFSAKAFLKE